MWMSTYEEIQSCESPDLGAVAQERRGAGCVTGKKEDLMLRTLRSCW